MSRSALMALANGACTTVWGQSIILRPGLSSQETITAVFDSAHATEQLQDGVPISTLRPVVDYTTADVSVQPVVGDTLTAASVNYKVVDLQQDNGGMTKLLLLRA